MHARGPCGQGSRDGANDRTSGRPPEIDSDTAARSAHATTTIVLGRLVGDAGFGGQHQARHGGGVLDGKAYDLGRVEHPGGQTPPAGVRHRDTGATWLGMLTGTVGYAAGLMLSALLDLPSGAVIVLSLTVLGVFVSRACASRACRNTESLT